MPSPTDVAHQFDSIEDTIAAFSKFSSHIANRCHHNKCSAVCGVNRATETNPPLSIENGEFIIVLDSQDRENEGDLIIAAESITAAQMAFLVRYTR